MCAAMTRESQFARLGERLNRHRSSNPEPNTFCLAWNRNQTGECSMTKQANGSSAASAGTNPLNETLDQIRASAQQLHGAISDAATQRTGDMKAALAKIPDQAKALGETLKNTVNTSSDEV